MSGQGSERTDAQPHLLRRRTTDRVLGGVAGGLGDYLNIDPLLIRIAFVGLMIFGGAGLVLYVAAWLLIPTEGQDSFFLAGDGIRAATVTGVQTCALPISSSPRGRPSRDARARGGASRCRERRR